MVGREGKIFVEEFGSHPAKGLIKFQFLFHKSKRNDFLLLAFLFSLF